MAAMASSFFSLPSIPKLHGTTLHPCPTFFTPYLPLKFPRLGISLGIRKESKHVSPVVISCSIDDNSEAYSELEESSCSNDSTPGAIIDLKLPRRSLLVHFTCNSCGERSQKLINRLAYDKGTVFVQCSGCSQYHKLVDNLSLVVEYDLREETDASFNTNQA